MTSLLYVGRLFILLTSIHVLWYFVVYCSYVPYIIYLYCAQYNEIPILYTYYYFDISSIHILYLILLVHYNKYLSEYFTCITFPFVVCNFNAITYMYNNGYPWCFSRKCMTQHKHVTVVGEYFGYLCWSCEMINVYSSWVPPSPTKFTSSVNYETWSSFLIHMRESIMSQQIKKNTLAIYHCWPMQNFTNSLKFLILQYRYLKNYS